MTSRTGDILAQVFGDEHQDWTEQYNQRLHILHERADKANDVKFWTEHAANRDFFDQHTFMTDGVFHWTNYKAYQQLHPKHS